MSRQHSFQSSLWLALRATLQGAVWVFYLQACTFFVWLLQQGRGLMIHTQTTQGSRPLGHEVALANASETKRVCTLARCNFGLDETDSVQHGPHVACRHPGCPSALAAGIESRDAAKEGRVALPECSVHHALAPLIVMRRCPLSPTSLFSNARLMPWLSLYFVLQFG